MSLTFEGLRRWVLHWLLPGVKLRLGQRIWLSGGYDGDQSEWLGGRKAVFATAERYMDFGGKPSLVAKLDHPLSVGATTGSFVVLTLRFEGARWGQHEIVHVELFPEGASISPGQGVHVESHAAYAVV